jgi:hypothetical protein
MPDGRLVGCCSNTTGGMRHAVFPHDSGHHPHEDELSRRISDFRLGRRECQRCVARCKSPCVVASRPFGVVVAPAFVAKRLAPHGFLGSEPTGQDGVTGAIVDAQVGSVTHQTEVRRPEGIGVSRNRRVMVWVNDPSSTPRRRGLEVRLVAQPGIQQPTEPVGHRDNCRLVATPRAS